MENSTNKAVWHLDATAIALFDSIDEAIRALNAEEDEIFIDIGDEHVCVSKKDIGIMLESEFNTL